MAARIAIVIPIYRELLEWHEQKAISQCFKVLNKYDIYIVKPFWLNLSKIEFLQNELFNFREISFEDTFFESISGYNRLLLSSAFYYPFLRYDYILVYQTDAYIFRDDIVSFAEKDFDYIGAPWLNTPHAQWQIGMKSKIRRILIRWGWKKYDAVGNGGFSMRKTKSVYDLLQKHKDFAANYTMNEDFFFAFEASGLSRSFRTAPVKDALKFSFDINPHFAFRKNNKNLPMGCHAWHNHMDFWNEYIMV